ncbi:MAG: 4-alpha-glucanotransferase, partial [Endomicrobiales bacterium]
NAAEKAAAMLGSGAKVIVTVTGGFHVPGFTRLLEEKKISYLEVTPNVTEDTAGAEALYTELIARQGRMLTQMMAARPLSQGGKFSRIAGMFGSYITDRLRQGAPRAGIEEKLKEAVDNGQFKKRFGAVAFELSEARRRGAARVFRFSITARENGAPVTRQYAGENDRMTEETEAVPAGGISREGTIPLLARGKDLLLTLLGQKKVSRDQDPNDGCIGKFDRVSVTSAQDLPDGRMRIGVTLQKQGGGAAAEAKLYGTRAPPEYLEEDFSKVSPAPVFQSVWRILDGFLKKNAGTIDDIVIQDAEFSEESGLTLADIGGVGGVQVLSGRPLRALRGPLAAERVARFHELAHMAFSRGALRLDDVLAAVTDKKIREELYEAKLRDRTLPEAVRFHHALRAFQRQYFGDEDEKLSRKIRRLSAARDQFPPQWFRGMKTYYAFLRDVVDPSSGRAADSFGTFTDLKFLFRHVKSMGLNAVFLMPLCEPASFDFEIDGSPYCALSAYALDSRHVDWKATGLEAKTLFDRAQEFGRRLPPDFAALENDPHILQYAHVKTLRSLTNGNYRRQGGYDLPGRSDGDFEKFRSLSFKDFGDLSSPAAATDEYQQIFRMVLMEQYFARKQLAEAVSLAHALGVFVGFDHPFLRSMNGTDAAFNPGIFERRRDGHIRAAGYDIGGRNQQLWGDEETQEGLARYNWYEVRAQGYEPLIGPVKYFVEHYGFDFVRGDALHFGYGQDGFYETLAGFCRENGVLLVPETLGGGADVNERCEALGMVPIETPSGPRGWKGAPTAQERWQELFHYLAAASKGRAVWNPVHHDALTTAGEYASLFDDAILLEVRLKALYALFGLALPNYSLFFGDEYGRTERINSPGVAHAWKKDSPYGHPEIDLTAHIARINALREQYPFLGDPGTLRYWTVSKDGLSFVRGSGNGGELKVTIDLSTGKLSVEEFSLPVDGKTDAQEIARAAKMLSHFLDAWAGDLYTIYKTRENDGQFKQAFGGALLLLLFDKDEALRRGAAEILSKPEFAGTLEHAGLGGWQDRSVLNVLLYWDDAKDNPWLVEHLFRAAGAEQQRWIAAQVLSALLYADTGAQRTRALKALYGIFGRYDSSPLELVHRFDRRLYAVLQKQGTIPLLRRSAKELGIVPELGAVVAGLQEASKHFLYDDPSLGGWTVVAGSPHFDQRNGAWLSNWGRDTMISLPGLCLATGREDLLRSVALNYLRFVKDGLLPNFVGDGKNPGFNSVDASMWLFFAVGEYLKQTGDYGFLSSRVDRRFGGQDTVRKVLEEMIERYRNGTEFSFMENGRTVTARVGMDDDGLVFAGDAHTQLTWMDGKPDNGEPVTARYGKAVEVNALWYNALGVMAEICRRENNAKAGQYAELAQRVKKSFDRFWNEAEQCLYDTVDGDEATGARVRPNQLFAVSLGLLDPERAARVVEKARRELFTRYGMRTLSPKDPAYQGVHTGVPTYHQGTIWPWPAGAFIEAHQRVYGAPATRQFLEDTGYLTTMAEFLETVHSVPEILNGDCESSRHWNTLGCGQQAWSVAAPLYALAALEARQKVSVRCLVAAGAAAGLLAAAVCFTPLFPALGALAGTIAAGGAAVSSVYLLGVATQLRLVQWLVKTGVRKALPLGERERRIHRFRQLVSSRGITPVSDDAVGFMEADPAGKLLRYNPEAVVSLGDIPAKTVFLLHERAHFG